MRQKVFTIVYHCDLHGQTLMDLTWVLQQDALDGHPKSLQQVTLSNAFFY